MDSWISKFHWYILGLHLLCICINAQDIRSQHRNNRRKLPTVIITKEHLKRMPQLYGPIGGTAAEFIVSAGLDNTHSSAVRIRKVGSRGSNGTLSPNPILNSSRVDNFNPQEPPRRPDPINNNFNIANDRRQPVIYRQSINRRQDVLNERNNAQFHHQRFFPTVDVNINGPHPRYVPPIFVPYYQQQPQNPGHDLRPAFPYRPSFNNPNRPAEGYDYQYRTAPKPYDKKPHIQPDFNKDKITNTAIYPDPVPTGIDKIDSDSDQDDTDIKFNEEHPKEEMKKTATPHKHIVAETPVLRLNRVKPQDAKNLIIRRPSLVLRDQITVNEVGESSERPRFGPRALQFDEDTSRTSRRKRQADSGESLKEKFSHFQSKRISHNIDKIDKSNEEENESDSIKLSKERNESDSIELSKEQNETTDFPLLSSLKNILGEFTKNRQRLARKYAFQQFDDSKVTNYSRTNSSDEIPANGRSAFYSDVNYQAQMDHFPLSSDDRSQGDVMSFSDFLASPLAEQIRLERQVMFRNSSFLNDSLINENFNVSAGFDSITQNSTLLKNIVAAKLLQSILNIDGNISSNATRMDDVSHPRSNPDKMASSEQRQFGIVVSPYDGHESFISKSTMPVIRILKGKIVPLPDLPQELIPILLGTYRPSYTSEASFDDPKLTDSILDNALLSLLKNEEMMNQHRQVNRKLHPMGYRLNRKSPSTNYIGSMKASEPVEKTSHNYKPNEWSLGPRCDRLTEEICLDDSDYPRASGNPCKYVVSPIQSTCAQVYSYHRLLVFNKDLGLHIDLFRVPTSCACHLRAAQQDHTSKFSSRIPMVHRPNPYEEFGGHVETAPSPQLMSEGSSTGMNDKKNSFSSTLWAILGGGQQASALAQQPQFLDEVQKQISWTQQMKHFPQLLKQISPNQVLKQLLEDDEDEVPVRRQRVRQPADRYNSGGFASHPVPISVPLPPPPPPPMIIARRPVVGAATPDQKHLFGMPSNAQAKIIKISPTESSTKVFSLTKEGSPGKTVVRLTESSPQSIFGGSSVHELKAYKIRPGMYHPSTGTGEKIQISEASLVPVAPQFSDQANSEGVLKPILKPMPVPKGSNKRVVEDEDLIAVEKSEEGEVHAFKVETFTEQKAPEDSTEDSSEDGKINFSYHPILEYLNL
ncbi:Neurotrophin 1 like protein [Argiope bruennichi]|uniref:Neurotrophin 1 like protein n=1 Tax=Argiope bruennichi TaxID=94029 RepID=A0A8T0E295_ARGBR|nr:Neurotrophin 1 like protein [Argiope bruennichi]